MKLKYVTITGADDSTDIEWMREVQQRFPFVEWGILVSQKPGGRPRFPSDEWLQRVVQDPRGLRLSLHVCSTWVRQAVKGDWTFIGERDGLVAKLLMAVSRVQLNFSPYVQELGDAFFESLRLRVPLLRSSLIFQVQKDAPVSDLLARAWAVDFVPAVLYDNSGGRGVLPTDWLPSPDGVVVGYAGGLGPDNINEQIDLIAEVATGTVWIDMERRVRTDDNLSLDRDAVLSVLRKCNVSPHLFAARYNTPELLQAHLLKTFGQIPLVTGYRRSIYLCGRCGKPFANDYIPYAIGRGQQYYTCSCGTAVPSCDYMRDAKHVCDVAVSEGGEA